MKTSKPVKSGPELPASLTAEPAGPVEPPLPWLSALRQSKRWLAAALEPETFIVRYANLAFRNLFGFEADSADAIGPRLELFELIPGLTRPQLTQMIRSQDTATVSSICSDHFETSFTAIVSSPHYPQTRIVKLWFGDGTARHSMLAPDAPTITDNTRGNLRPIAPTFATESPDGLILLEGFDVTVLETLRQLTRLLVERISILTPERFRQIEGCLRSLFRAQQCFILCLERDPARLFIASSEQKSLEISRYPLLSLSNSRLVNEAQRAAVCSVATIPQEEVTCELDCRLQALGTRSLLLIPLYVANDGKVGHRSQLVGLIGITSDRADAFDADDVRHAQELVEPYTTALRFSLQQSLTSFSNIQPAVEWRFLEEAERRNWGLPPQPIEFPDVYPLYGISDIRGSSESRNQAIQADLLQQFRAGLAVLEAVAAETPSGLAKQLKLDLLEQMGELEQGVDVDTEDTAIDYLKRHLEIYFDHFERCSDAAAAAVRDYRQASDNEHHCVYEARARYDATVSRVIGTLRKTWEHCQARMQQIIPHYSDINCTDGIDHMIYAGQSIYPEFRSFHLHSLRYEQLRAICACARSVFEMGGGDNIGLQITHLVLIQQQSVDIFHDEKSDTLFAVRGSRDSRYEIVKKRIEKACDDETNERITQPGMLTLVYSTDEEWEEWQQYLRYLAREGWVDSTIDTGNVEPLQGVSGLAYARVRILP